MGKFELMALPYAIDEQVGIAVPAEAWGTDVLLLTDEQKAALKALADKLIEG